MIAHAMVRTLICGGASFDAKFIWKAGLFALLWEGPIIFAAVVANRLNVLRMLASAKAALDGKLAHLSGVPVASLIYEASCRGHIQIVRYLGQRGKGEPNRGTLE